MTEDDARRLGCFLVQGRFLQLRPGHRPRTDLRIHATKRGYGQHGKGGGPGPNYQPAFCRSSNRIQPESGRQGSDHCLSPPPGPRACSILAAQHENCDSRWISCHLDSLPAGLILPDCGWILIQPGNAQNGRAQPTVGSSLLGKRQANALAVLFPPHQSLLSSPAPGPSGSGWVSHSPEPGPRRWATGSRFSQFAPSYPVRSGHPGGSRMRSLRCWS